MDSPPHDDSKQHTPTSLSRTRNATSSQRNALERLKHKLTYEDEVCGEIYVGELSENSLISENYVSTSEKDKQMFFFLNACGFRDVFVF
jgi:hypothetical protein